MLGRMARRVGTTRNHTPSGSHGWLGPLASPRGFQPPSYYARAAGIGNSSSQHSTKDHPVDATEPTVNTYQSGFVPVSYPTGSYTSDSSLDQKIYGEKRFAVLCRRKSSSVSRSSSTSSRRGRITGLPQLEREILPSLKDTVERMTRTPPLGISPLSPPSVCDQEQRGDITSTGPGLLDPGPAFQQCSLRFGLRTPTQRFTPKNDHPGPSKHAAISTPSKLQKTPPHGKLIKYPAVQSSPVKVRRVFQTHSAAPIYYDLRPLNNLRQGKGRQRTPEIDILLVLVIQHHMQSLG